MTDAEAEAFARHALTIQDPVGQKAALTRLRAHRFKTSRIKEREFVLYAQGLLEDRLGEPLRAAVTLRKLEVTWPQSPYLTEVQTILALQAIERRKYKDAERRLRKALESDIPVESKRRTQELLLWTLVEQDRSAEGLPIVKSLHPLGSAKPSERGLVATFEVLALAGEKEQAEAIRKDFRNLYPASPYDPRVNLAWARLLSSKGQMVDAAETLRNLIQSHPTKPEADEARLALATLLSEGKLHPKEAEAFPTPQKLLAEIRKSDRKGDKTRRALLVELRTYMGQAQWKEAIGTTERLLASNPTAEERLRTLEFRAESLRAWTQQMLDGKSLDPILPYFDRTGVAALSPEQRLLVVKALAQRGMPDAAWTVTELSPTKERPALLRAAAEVAEADSDPEAILKLLPSRGGTSAQALRRAQALVALKRWNEARLSLGHATPGPARIAALRAYLQRPFEKGEAVGPRLREAEGWLARLSEKGVDREAIVIVVADIRARLGNWRGALALYPEQAQPGTRGWVALMRATCQLKLGRKEAAVSILRAAVDEPDFRMERETLGKTLGI